MIIYDVMVGEGCDDSSEKCPAEIGGQVPPSLDKNINDWLVLTDVGFEGLWGVAVLNKDGKKRVLVNILSASYWSDGSLEFVEFNSNRTKFLRYLGAKLGVLKIVTTPFANHLGPIEYSPSRQEFRYKTS